MTLVYALEEWKDVLQRARRQFYYLTYLHSPQLLALHCFITQKLEMDSFLRSTLAFINPNYNIGTNVPIAAAASLFDDVCNVGRFLDSVSFLQILIIIEYC